MTKYTPQMTEKQEAYIEFLKKDLTKEDQKDVNSRMFPYSGETGPNGGKTRRATMFEASQIIKDLLDGRRHNPELSRYLL